MSRQKGLLRAGLAGAVAALFAPFPGLCQTFDQARSMDFGRIALTTYSQVGTLVVHPDGSYTATPEILVLDPPSAARFDATGFPANTAATLSVTDADATLGGGGAGQAFTIRDFVSAPGVLSTNGAGNMTFDLGATLRSAGDGQVYPDGSYSTTITLTLVL